MNDSTFKSLNHLAKSYKIISRGSQLIHGYKPDIVLQHKNNFIIVECETGTNRKGYVGGMIKAAKFLTGENKGFLIYVIKEKKNTKELQIAKHLSEYFSWIKPLTNLKDVYVITTDKYCPASQPVKILSKEFCLMAKVISSTRQK